MTIPKNRAIKRASVSEKAKHHQVVENILIREISFALKQLHMNNLIKSSFAIINNTGHNKH